MQDFIELINASTKVEKKLDAKSKVIRVVQELDPLYTDFVTYTVDVADVDLKTCDYKNVRRYQRISGVDGIWLCDWYQVPIKNQGGNR